MPLTGCVTLGKWFYLPWLSFWLSEINNACLLLCWGLHKLKQTQCRVPGVAPASFSINGYLSVICLIRHISDCLTHPLCI